jgi:peptidoglycan/LPS O-acetylase OafA/YrhL
VTVEAISRFRHEPGLDGVRGIAILFVVASHAGSEFFFQGGFIGVDLFFCLSGYLITSLLFVEYAKTGAISFSRFYIRRALRLLPALFLGLLFITAVWSFAKPGYMANQILATVSSLFYFANIIPVEKMGLCSHLWSLSVEEHFYFLWPMMVLLLAAISFSRRITFIFIAIVAVCVFRSLVFRFHLGETHDILSIIPYRFTFCRMDSILWGCLLAVIKLNRGFVAIGEFKSIGPCAAILPLVIYGFVGQSVIQPYMYYAGFPLVDLLCAVVLYTVVGNPQSFFSNSMLRWIGRRSYGIYVYHSPIMQLSDPYRIEHHTVNNLAVVLVTVGLVFLAAEVSFRWVESPILALKRRWKSAA